MNKIKIFFSFLFFTSTFLNALYREKTLQNIKHCLPALTSIYLYEKFKLNKLEAASMDCISDQDAIQGIRVDSHSIWVIRNKKHTMHYHQKGDLLQNYQATVDNIVNAHPKTYANGYKIIEDFETNCIHIIPLPPSIDQSISNQNTSNYLSKYRGSGSPTFYGGSVLEKNLERMQELRAELNNLNRRNNFYFRLIKDLQQTLSFKYQDRLMLAFSQGMSIERCFKEFSTMTPESWAFILTDNYFGSLSKKEILEQLTELPLYKLPNFYNYAKLHCELFDEAILKIGEKYIEPYRANPKKNKALLNILQAIKVEDTGKSIYDTFFLADKSGMSLYDKLKQKKYDNYVAETTIQSKQAENHCRQFLEDVQSLHQAGEEFSVNETINIFESLYNDAKVVNKPKAEQLKKLIAALKQTGSVSIKRMVDPCIRQQIQTLPEVIRFTGTEVQDYFVKEALSNIKNNLEILKKTKDNEAKEITNGSINYSQLLLQKVQNNLNGLNLIDCISLLDISNDLNGLANSLIKKSNETEKNNAKRKALLALSRYHLRSNESIHLNQTKMGLELFNKINEIKKSSKNNILTAQAADDLYLVSSRLRDNQVIPALKTIENGSDLRLKYLSLLKNRNLESKNYKGYYFITAQNVKSFYELNEHIRKHKKHLGFTGLQFEETIVNGKTIQRLRFSDLDKQIYGPLVYQHANTHTNYDLLNEEINAALSAESLNQRLAKEIARLKEIDLRANELESIQNNKPNTDISNAIDFVSTPIKKNLNEEIQHQTNRIEYLKNEFKTKNIDEASKPVIQDLLENAEELNKKGDYIAAAHVVDLSQKFLEVSENQKDLQESLKGFAYGAKDGAVSQVKALKDIIPTIMKFLAHCEETEILQDRLLVGDKTAYDIVDQKAAEMKLFWEETAKFIKKVINEDMATAEGKGYIFGRIISEIGTPIYGPKVIAALGKTAPAQVVLKEVSALAKLAAEIGVEKVNHGIELLNKFSPAMKADIAVAKGVELALEQEIKLGKIFNDSIKFVKVKQNNPVINKAIQKAGLPEIFALEENATEIPCIVQNRIKYYKDKFGNLFYKAEKIPNFKEQFINKIKSKFNGEVEEIVTPEGWKMKLPEGEHWLSEEGLVNKLDVQDVTKKIEMAHGVPLTENSMQVLSKIEAQIADLERLFKDKVIKAIWAETKDITEVYINSEGLDHIFCIDLRNKFDKAGIFKGQNYTGLHQDYLGELEKIGIFRTENIRSNSNGFYIADVICGNTIKRDRSFFPNHWTREKTVQKIFEACENLLEAPIVNRDGSKKLRGITKEGIKIEIRVYSDGKIITAFPIL